jgi:hypothetical protein
LLLLKNHFFDQVEKFLPCQSRFRQGQNRLVKCFDIRDSLNFAGRYLLADATPSATVRYGIKHVQGISTIDDMELLKVGR